jgi:beta-1,4-mannosyltransferase
VVGLWHFLRLAKQLGIAVLWTVHDIEPHEDADTIDRLGYYCLACMADLRICHDEHTQQRLQRWYTLGNQTTVLMRHGNYDGVYPMPIPKEETLKSLHLDPQKTTLLCQGMIRPYKGFDIAIEVARAIQEECQVIIAGEPINPEYGAKLQQAAAGLSNLRLILKPISEQTIANLVEASDAMLLPYRKITGSGAFFTAITLSRGVITTDLPFFREYISMDPRIGTISASTDCAGIIQAIRAYRYRPLRERSEAAREMANRYPWQMTVTPIIDWLKNWQWTRGMSAKRNGGQMTPVFK